MAWIRLFLLWSALGCASAWATPGEPENSLGFDGRQEPGEPELGDVRQPGPPPVGGQVTPCPDSFYVVEHWPGEYPSPVIQVLEAVQVEARLGPCGTTGEVMATLKPGLYHPWSRTEDITEVAYFSIAPILYYELLEEVTFEEVMSPESTVVVAARGSVIENLAYLAEGWCRLRVNGVVVNDYCPGNGGQETRFRQVDPATGADSAATGMWDPLLRLRTPGQPEAWVVVSDSYPFKYPEIVRGRVTGFGEISPRMETVEPEEPGDR